jgi:hypothetical protein
MDMFSYRVRKAAASQLAALGSAEAIVFGGGIVLASKFRGFSFVPKRSFMPPLGAFSRLHYYCTSDYLAFKPEDTTDLGMQRNRRMRTVATMQRSLISASNYAGAG